MSGGLFVKALTRETGRELAPAEAERLKRLPADSYRRRLDLVRPLPGARDLLRALTNLGVPWAIATSGGDATARPSLEALATANRRTGDSSSRVGTPTAHSGR